MISFDNLFTLRAESLGLPKAEDGEVTLVSHAHTDHLPTRYSKNHIHCSPITKRMIILRKKLKEIKEYDHTAIKQYNAGHVLGSTMFLVNKDLLYTGDFNPQGEYSGKATPVKCKTLIMECTYGSPEYVFPPKKEVLKELKEYIDKNKKVLIMSIDSSFGKPQEICQALEENNIPFNTNPLIAKTNEYLGLQFKNFDPKSHVVLTDKYSSYHFPSEYKRVHLSGWFASDTRFKMGIDKGFVFSNHADYPSLIEFVEKCNPDIVYTHHGPSESFAKDLRNRGFNAKPLSILTQKPKKGVLQHTLSNFFS